MGRKEKFSPYEKLTAIEDYLSRKRGVFQICRDMNICESSFYEWLKKYEISGLEALTNVRKNKYYPEAVKQQAIRDYLGGEVSLREICRRYGISSNSILRKWIKKYNGHGTLKSHNSQGDKIMTKGRKTTFEERIEIVSFCIENNYNYQMASEKFQVSYQQIYTWVKKYEEYGSESLLDKRGNRKRLEELSETEKLAAQLKLLEAENNRLKMENDYLKKLDEIERRR
ncbi:MAG: helix-turn-helix domain-containing protein [Clostridium sp.]|nr:helix-turn-helix domain-containing protein [Clostridium sp.]